MKKWKMPKWMELYREHIGNTGGNTVEELMRTCSLVQVNAPRALLECAVASQVDLLERLRGAGFLGTPPALYLVVSSDTHRDEKYKLFGSEEAALLCAVDEVKEHKGRSNRTVEDRLTDAQRKEDWLFYMTIGVDRSVTVYRIPVSRQ